MSQLSEDFEPVRLLALRVAKDGEILRPNAVAISPRSHPGAEAQALYLYAPVSADAIDIKLRFTHF